MRVASWAWQGSQSVVTGVPRSYCRVLQGGGVPMSEVPLEGGADNLWRAARQQRPAASWRPAALEKPAKQSYMKRELHQNRVAVKFTTQHVYYK